MSYFHPTQAKGYSSFLNFEELFSTQRKMFSNNPYTNKSSFNFSTHFKKCVHPGIRTIARMDTIPKYTIPKDTIPNGHHPEWTQSQMCTIPNGHHPEWKPSRMRTIPNGHHPEWTQSRMSTYNYIVTLVFNSYCLVRSLLRRRGFIQKLILCMNLSDL